MHLHFNGPVEQGFRLIEGLPANFNGYVLKGSEAHTLHGQAGVMVLQQLSHRHFSIRLNFFEFFQPTSIAARQAPALLVSIFALKNHIHYALDGLGILHLQQGQLALLHTQEQELQAAFEKGKKYESLEVAWSREIIEQLAPYYSRLTPLLHDGPARCFVLPPLTRNAGAGILDLLQAIFHAPYEDAVSRLYFEYKVREYLLLLLQEPFDEPRPTLKLTDEERERLHALELKLRNEPAAKFPIEELARTIGMNEMKLKLSFKEMFGRSIFEYHLEARMQEARRLLIETDYCTKQVAALTGYKFTTSFITKFTEYFGYPPSKLRRN